ncbi:unnamed protein product, partial [marine sediment metagenome]
MKTSISRLEAEWKEAKRSGNTNRVVALHTELARVYAYYKLFKSAAQQLNKAREAAHKGSIDLNTVEAVSLYIEGLSLLQDGEGDEAIGRWERSLELNPADDEIRELVGISYLNRANRAFNDKRFQEARENYTRAKEACPDSTAMADLVDEKLKERPVEPVKARPVRRAPTKKAPPVDAEPVSDYTLQSIGTARSAYGPHPTQKGLKPLYERVAWTYKNAPDGLRIRDIQVLKSQKHGRRPVDAVSFRVTLEDGIILKTAGVMGGISAGVSEPNTHASTDEAIDETIEFFNENVRERFIGLNVSQPDQITKMIVQLDEEFKTKAQNTDRPRFSYIGSEISVGVSM